MNMGVDKKSRYGYLGNGGKLMGVWGVEDGVRDGKDINMGYGFEKEKLIKDKDDEWID
ncbi:hypothetical protein [Staphylococcus warneri]|uniref:hypothetical protein n=1 Tax=Staphylococcus warneri TaxID=1292 RepID=UPI00164382C8|nr:hypothetical protein [Staphylococcus warneri]